MLFRFLVVSLLCGLALAKPQSEPVPIEVSVPISRGEASESISSNEVSTNELPSESSTEPVLSTTYASSSESSEEQTSSPGSNTGSSGASFHVSIEVALIANGNTGFVDYLYELGLDDLLNNTAHVQQDQAALDQAISTFDNKTFNATYYSSSDGLVSNGGAITEAPNQAENANILQISNVCPQTQQTIYDKLKSIGGPVATLLNGMKNLLPNTANLFKNVAAQNTVLVLSPSVLNSCIQKLATGQVGKVQTILNGNIFPGAYSFADFQELGAANQSIVTAGGQSVPVQCIDDKTIQIGSF